MIVAGHVFAAIADAILGEDGHGCMKFRIDVLKAAISASEKYTNSSGEQTLLSGSQDYIMLQL